MRGIRRNVALLVFIVMAAATGCTNDEPDSSRAAIGRVTFTNPSITLGSPPQVQNPLDVRPFVDRVCTLLSTEQLDELGFGQPDQDGTQPFDEAVPQCVWDDKDERSGQLVVWPYPDTDVLAQDYRGDEYYEIVREVTIGGYPGLLQVPTPGSWVCKITLGLGNDQGIRVQYLQNRPPTTETEVCGLATAVAQAIVTNLGSRRRAVPRGHDLTRPASGEIRTDRSNRDTDRS